ncbi:MAG: hypothetical protein QME51_10830, partial [Planctomycetota bacterium]|nr:hypothetical protein [Planctomycetota bacterium]
LFCGISFQSYGLWGLFAFLSLTVATYSGFFIHFIPVTETKALKIIIVRWAVNYAVFFFVAILLGMPHEMEKWIYHKDIYNYGISYFLILGVFELCGFYQARWIEEWNISKMANQQ